MKTFILSISLLVTTYQSKQDSVWLCMGNYSHAYHASLYCKGLRNCKGKEVRVSIYDAIHKYHRHACGYCEK